MSRPRKWVQKGFKAIKVKVDLNTHEQYKAVLRKEKTTAQEDLSKTIKEKINK